MKQSSFPPVGVAVSVCILRQLFTASVFKIPAFFARFGPTALPHTMTVGSVDLPRIMQIRRIAQNSPVCSINASSMFAQAKSQY